MSNTMNSPIKSLLSTGQTIQQHILEVCKPLLEMFNITFFAHARAFDDNSVAILISNVALAEHWLQQQYPLGVFTEPGVYLASELGELYSVQQQQSLRELFNIDHAVYIINRYETHADIFLLATTPDNRHIVHTYLTHIDHIKRFLHYYQHKCHKLIKLAEKCRLAVPAKTEAATTIWTPSTHLSLQGLDQSCYFINETVGVVSLTSQQKACLHSLIQGKSAKEIANQLNLSKRTVETYINHIKQKFKCTKVTQLAYLVGRANIDVPVKD